MSTSEVFLVQRYPGTVQSSVMMRVASRPRGTAMLAGKLRTTRLLRRMSVPDIALASISHRQPTSRVQGPLVRLGMAHDRSLPCASRAISTCDGRKVYNYNLSFVKMADTIAASYTPQGCQVAVALQGSAVPTLSSSLIIGGYYGDRRPVVDRKRWRSRPDRRAWVPLENRSALVLDLKSRCSH